MNFKKLRVFLIFCILATSFLVGGAAHAQDEGLPDPGITPDSPFYFLDQWGKAIGMFFTFGNEAKASKALQYAEERLAEAQAMATKNRIREMTRAANDYDGYMAQVNERLEAAATGDAPERVALAAARHLGVLDGIKERVAEQGEEAITRARNASVNGQVNALRILAEANPERAFEINEAAIEGLMERASARVAEGQTGDIEETLDIASRLAEIEDEMINIAEANGIDITALRQRLTQSTSNRLEVLAGVYEKVPEQARAAVENAMENSVRKYERAVEELKETDDLGETPEEAPALQRIQEEVRERIQQRVTTELQNASDDVQIEIRVQTEERAQERVEENTREGTENSNEVMGDSGNREEKQNETATQTETRRGNQ